MGENHCQQTTATKNEHEPASALLFVPDIQRVLGCGQHFAYELAHRLGRAPRRELVEREMDHHRPRSVPVARHVAPKVVRQLDADEQARIQRLRCQVRDHRTLGVVALMSVEHGLGAPVVDQDVIGLRAGHEAAAVRVQERHERVYNRPGSATAESQAVLGELEGLQEREQGAAGEIGREVEVHTPGGE